MKKFLLFFVMFFLSVAVANATDSSFIPKEVGVWKWESGERTSVLTVEKAEDGWLSGSLLLPSPSLETMFFRAKIEEGESIRFSIPSPKEDSGTACEVQVSATIKTNKVGQAGLEVLFYSKVKEGECKIDPFEVVFLKQ